MQQTQITKSNSPSFVHSVKQTSSTDNSVSDFPRIQTTDIKQTNRKSKSNIASPSNVDLGDHDRTSNSDEEKKLALKIVSRLIVYMKWEFFKISVRFIRESLDYGDQFKMFFESYLGF